MTNLTHPQEVLEFAGNMLDRHNMIDAGSPNLLDMTGIAQHGVPTSSGLKDCDYQNLSSLSMGQVDLIQMATVNKIPIPPEVMEHFKHIKCHCMMGLFPEIGRAWLTIDSDIYIWTYESTRDVAFFDGLSHIIVSVGIVTPKAGVFVGDVKHLLVITTPVEIVILGVTFGDSTKISSSPIRSASIVYEEMQLINKPIFLLNTDNVAITTIKGTESGRIFLGGRDGCLYEIYYQAESNWFGKRCKKINHSQGLMSLMMPGFLKAFSETDPISKIEVDNSRNLLYALTEKGSIEVWDLGSDHSCVRRVVKLSQNDICYQASAILKSVDETMFKPVTAICPLQNTDTQYLHLVGVTSTGVRFYFSTTSLQSQMISADHHYQEPQRPHNLYLMHIRMPPGYTPNSTLGKPSNVHNAFYSQGTILMMSSSQQENDILWSFSSEPFNYPPRQLLVESTTMMPLDGQVWAVAEVKRKSNKNQITKRIVLLTNHGAHIVSLFKPADMLQQLLTACGGAQHEAVKAYFKSQSEVQACATAVSIACLEPLRGSELAMWAIQAFLMYGGEPHLEMTNSTIIQDNRMLMSTPFAASTPAQIGQQSMIYPPRPNFASPQTPANVPFGGNMQPDLRNMQFSYKHTALYLHLARLLRPIWRRRCVDDSNNSTINHEDCVQILSELYEFRRFVETNSVITSPATFSSRQMRQADIGASALYNNESALFSPQSRNRNTEESLYAEEKQSLESLLYFIRQSCEILSLWKILLEHQFELLVAALPKEHQNVLLACIFRDLIMFRADTCASLIISLINSYLNDNASLGSISAKLRDVCPTLYRDEDAVSHKATEILLLSKHSRDEDDKDTKLFTALKLCKEAAPNVPLSSICQQFVATEFYNGVIDLCATCAAKIDPKDLALHYYRNNGRQSVEDQEGFLAFTARSNCYKEITAMLEKLYQNMLNAMNSASGSPNKTLPPIVTNDQNNLVTQQILPIVSTALQTSDHLLHYAVYEWLLSHDLLGRLLGINEPSLGTYLTQTVTKNPENLLLADLLWKYYERNGQHSGAAKILDTLASMKCHSIPLDKRFEYLARAVMCMRNDGVGSSAHNGVLLKDLEDKLEIAQVQKQIHEALVKKRHTDHLAAEAISNLNYTLYSMTDLYSEFADNFDLSECKLTILNCSHHNDPLLIESVWMKILDTEMLNADSGMEKSYRIVTKVKNLAREYGTTGQCFPLAFLVHELEMRCCRLRLNQYPIPQAFIEMNIDVGHLIDIYSRLVSLNERIWANAGDEYYLIKSVETFTRLLTRQPNLYAKNRRKIVAKTQDLASSCLSLLYTKRDVQPLIDSLRDIQTKIQRCG